MYNSYGIPCIASPIGVNVDILSHNNGILANDKNDWVNGLNTYLLKNSIRKTHGNNGYEMVRKKFDHHIIFRKWVKNLTDDQISK